MKPWAFLLLLLIAGHSLIAQELSYKDSLQSFRDKYLKEHEVIKGKEQEQLRFFPIDRQYSIMSRLEKIDEAPWFSMQTSGTKKKVYRVYGVLHFMLNGKPCKLEILQSQDLLSDPAYADYLLIAFTDLTSGEETYENGRYIDVRIAELGTGNYLLDFNKAYNPYCAYISNKYNCPIPPKQNDLPVAIRAGEMKLSRTN